jgi:hypothetical protein
MSQRFSPLQSLLSLQKFWGKAINLDSTYDNSIISDNVPVIVHMGSIILAKKGLGVKYAVKILT